MLARTSLVSTMAVLVTLAAGCAAKDANDDRGQLGTSESLLVADNNEIEENDEEMEAGLEDPLSGAVESDPGTPAEGASEDDVLGKIKTNPGKWFKPAGCIASTWVKNVATHVFKGCGGPYGLAKFDGTVTSTYSYADGVLTVTHEANGFAMNGSSLSGKRTVTYTKSGSVITKHRVGNWTGTTKNGKPFTHDADFTITWDASAKCITRDGNASTTVASRELSRSIAGYKRCGIGNLGCPEAGTIVLSRTKGDNEASVTIEFLGGRQYTVSGSNGRTESGRLVCRESSST